jgi:hypothetical protein
MDAAATAAAASHRNSRVPSSRRGVWSSEMHATLARLIDGRGQGGTPDKQETVEAAAADAASEREIARERRAGGAQEVRRDRAGARPDTRRG